MATFKMTIKIIFVTVMIYLCTCGLLLAQGIQYVYDDNGNRIQKIVIPARFSSNSGDSIKSILTSENDNYIITIFPNPTKSVIDLEITPFKENTSLKVTDIKGKIIFQNDQLTSNHLKIDMTSYDNGTYFVIVGLDKKFKSYAIQKME
ncbi:MAG: T9SS type A sorting domain-containing protein [Bacteroidia bacterium]|nr:T9SS type A sorting domain-containing protein [Bacteroidia bacterium]